MRSRENAVSPTHSLLLSLTLSLTHSLTASVSLLAMCLSQDAYFRGHYNGWGKLGYRCTSPSCSRHRTVRDRTSTPGANVSHGCGCESARAHTSIGIVQLVIIIITRSYMLDIEELRACYICLDCKGSSCSVNWKL